MPPREPLAMLEDARSQAMDLVRKVDGSTLESILGDRDLQAIIERRFEILGEALRRLRQRDMNLFDRIPGANEAIAVRNIIAHGYDGVDHRILWSITHQFLPQMLAAIDVVIDERYGPLE